MVGDGGNDYGKTQIRLESDVVHEVLDIKSDQIQWNLTGLVRF